MKVKTSVRAGQPGPVHGGPIKFPWWPAKDEPCGGPVNPGPFRHLD